MGYPFWFVSGLSVLHKRLWGVCAGVCACVQVCVQVHHFSQCLSHGIYILDDAGCFPVTGLRRDYSLLRTKSFGFPGGSDGKNPKQCRR